MHSFRGPRFLAFCLVIGLLEARGIGQIPGTELHAISPSGAQIGTEVDFTIVAGKNLRNQGGVQRCTDADPFDAVRAIHFSHPGIQAQVLASAPTDSAPNTGKTKLAVGAQFRVKIGSEVPEGVYEVRLDGAFGLSNSRLFHVTRASWSIDKLEPSDPVIPLTWNSFIESRCEPRKRYTFSIGLTEGQRVCFRSLTLGLDSRTKLVQTLFTPDGLRCSSKEPQDGGDSDWCFDVQRTGEYRLVVHDHLYSGGDSYPFALGAFAADANRQSEQIDLVERWRVWSQAPDGQAVAAGDRLSTIVATLRKPAEAVQPIRMSGVIHSETGSNAERSQENQRPLALNAPSVIENRFMPGQPVHVYEMRLEAAAEWVMEVASQRLRQTSDIELAIGRVIEAGTDRERFQNLSSMDDTLYPGESENYLSHRDPILKFKVPESGVYRLLVRNNQSSTHGDPPAGYAMEVRQPRPGFSLVACPLFASRTFDQMQIVSANVPRNTHQPLLVSALRHDGFNQAIRVHAEELQPGVLSQSATIAPNQVASVIMLSTNAEASGRSDVLVRGIAIQSPESPVPESPVPDSPVPVTEIETQTETASVVARPVAFTWGSIPDLATPILRSTHVLTIQANPLQTVPLSIELGAVEPGTVALGTVASGTAAPGTIQPGTLQPLTAAPLEVELGQKVKLPLKLIRAEGGGQGVVVRLRQLPPKCTVNEITIPNDKSDGELELNVAADAPAGEYTLWAQCETKLSMRPPLNTLPAVELPVQLPSNTLQIRLRAPSPPPKP